MNKQIYSESEITLISNTINRNLAAGRNIALYEEKALNFFIISVDDCVKLMQILKYTKSLPIGIMFAFSNVQQSGLAALKK